MTMLSQTQAAILEKLERSPLGRKIRAEAEADTLARRQAAAAELERLDREHSAALPGLNAAVDREAEAVKKAQDAVKAAEAKHVDAYRDRQNFVTGAQHAKEQQRRILAELAPDSIDAFARELRDLADGMRRGGGPGSAGLDSHGGPIYKEERERIAAAAKERERFHARLMAVNQAARHAEELTFTALTPEQLEAKFAEIRASIEAAGR